MIKLITKLWPVFIPIVLYFVWFLFFRKKKDKNSQLSKTEERVWIITLVASIAVVFAYIIFILVTTEGGMVGEYTPAEFKGGKVVPAKIR